MLPGGQGRGNGSVDGDSRRKDGAPSSWGINREPLFFLLFLQLWRTDRLPFCLLPSSEMVAGVFVPRSLGRHTVTRSKAVLWLGLPACCCVALLRCGSRIGGFVSSLVLLLSRLVEEHQQHFTFEDLQCSELLAKRIFRRGHPAAVCLFVCLFVRRPYLKGGECVFSWCVQHTAVASRISSLFTTCNSRKNNQIAPTLVTRFTFGCDNDTCFPAPETRAEFRACCENERPCVCVYLKAEPTIGSRAVSAEIRPTERAAGGMPMQCLDFR